MPCFIEENQIFTEAKQKGGKPCFSENRINFELVLRMQNECEYQNSVFFYLN